MGGLINRLGERYGRLVVVERDPSSGKNRSLWKCRCDCGNFTTVETRDLRSGKQQSCGCLRRENMSKLGHEYGGANKKQA